MIVPVTDTRKDRSNNMGMADTQDTADTQHTADFTITGQNVAVLIPCYNEGTTIQQVIFDFQRVLPDAEIYVYDNASTDDTAHIASSIGTHVVYEPRRGKGNVVRQMFRDIEAEYYIMVDGDDTYPAEAAIDLLRPLYENKADMVVGDRLSNGSYGEENTRAFHGLGNNLVRWLIKHIYHYEYADVMTGYRAFNRFFVKTMPVLSKEFQIETEISIHAVDKNLRIMEVPIEYRDRPAGSYSKLNTLADGSAVIAAIVSLFKEHKPLRFFGWLSLIFIVLGVVFGVPVIVEYFDTGLVPRFPTALLAVALVLCGILSLVAGVILDNVSKSNKKQWEMWANREIECQQELKKHYFEKK